jgi:hypothetical protein
MQCGSNIFRIHLQEDVDRVEVSGPLATPEHQTDLVLVPTDCLLLAAPVEVLFVQPRRVTCSSSPSSLPSRSESLSLQHGLRASPGTRVPQLDSRRVEESKSLASKRRLLRKRNIPRGVLLYETLSVFGLTGSDKELDTLVQSGHVLLVLASARIVLTHGIFQ